MTGKNKNNFTISNDQEEGKEQSDNWMKTLWEWEETDFYPYYSDIETIDIKGFPLEKNKLINLKVLDLSSLEIYDIRKEIEKLTNLEVLNLAHNKIVDIPKEIWKLTSLEELKLGWNKIADISEEIGNLTNLRYLSLTENEIINLPNEITNLKKLQELYLRFNPLILTIEQKEWIVQLKNNKCKVYIDTDIPVLKTNPPRIPQIDEYHVVTDDTVEVDSNTNIHAWFDKKTGLLWEIKNIYNSEHLYVWSQKEIKSAEHSENLTDDTKDVLSYVHKLNIKNYAGFNDWRIPTYGEFLTIIVPELNDGVNRTPAYVDKPIFKFLVDKFYCLSPESVDDNEEVTIVALSNFGGDSYLGEKMKKNSSELSICCVRGGYYDYVNF